MKEEDRAMLALLRNMYDILVYSKGLGITGALRKSYRHTQRFDRTPDGTLDRAYARLEAYISDRLYPYGTYSGWLYNNSPEYRALAENDRIDAASAGRRDWVGHMLSLVKGEKVW